MNEHQLYIRGYSQAHSVTAQYKRASSLFNLKLTNSSYDKAIPYKEESEQDEKYRLIDNEIFHNLTIPCHPSKKGMNLMIENYLYDKIKFYLFINSCKVLRYFDRIGVERKEIELVLICIYLDTCQYHKYVMNYTIKPYCARSNDLSEMTVLLNDGNREVYSSEIHFLDQGERNEMCKFVSCFEEILDTEKFVQNYLEKHHVLLSFRLVEIVKKIREEKKHIVNIIKINCKCFYKNKEIFRCTCNNNILLVISNDVRFSNINF